MNQETNQKLDDLARDFLLDKITPEKYVEERNKIINGESIRQMEIDPPGREKEHT